MPSTAATERIISILADHAYGPGLSIADLRALYGRHVRRITLLETLQHLEVLELILWRNDRVWWAGPIPDDARPLGIRAARVRRIQRTTPLEGVEAWFRLRRMLPRAPGSTR